MATTTTKTEPVVEPVVEATKTYRVTEFHGISSGNKLYPQGAQLQLTDAEFENLRDYVEAVA